jgi:uncharacterized protein YuzE
MKIEYSEDVDALYVYLQEVEVARSVEPGDGIVVDYDASGAIVGVEILDASDRLNPVDAALMLKDSGPDYTEDQSAKIRAVVSVYARTSSFVEDDVD